MLTIRPKGLVCRQCGNRKFGIGSNSRIARSANSDGVEPRRIPVDEAFGILGVASGSSFDEVMQAKNKLASQHGGDKERMQEIEAAYDILFMQSMKKRLSGEVQVSTSVRYADVPSAPKKAPQARGPSAPRMMVPVKPSLPSVRIEMPQQLASVAPQAAVFAGLGIWSATQVLLESPEAQLADTAGLQMAIGLGYTVYTFGVRAKMPLGKAAGLSFGLLFASALLGTLVHSWLRVDIVPVAGFGSPGVLITEFILLGFLFGTVFLV